MKLPPKPPWKWTGPKPLARVLVASPGKSPKPLYECQNHVEGWRCGKCFELLPSLNLRAKCVCGCMIAVKIVDTDLVSRVERETREALARQERDRTFGVYR